MPDMTIRRALIAVYDKTGIIDFARALADEFGVEIISTGGTARHLTEAGIPVTLVEEVTGFPEMLDGRVKTLHPKIHAAILADRDNPEHMRQLAEQGIEPIDMVVVNLYPFEETIKKPDCTFDEAIEMIDIGGPCLLRAAAKNHRHVAVVCDPEGYAETLRWLRDEQPASIKTKDLLRWAGDGYATTSFYDAQVAEWLTRRMSEKHGWPTLETIFARNWGALRYGENPHQTADLWQIDDDSEDSDLTVADAEHSDQKEMSFNNYVDANAALGLCEELACALARGRDIEAPRGLQPAALQDDEPRASARAVVRTPTREDISNPLEPPDPKAPCWLLTWTTYGSWLPGDDRGFVSRAESPEGGHRIRNTPGTSYDAGQQDVAESARARMKGKAVSLTEHHALTVCKALCETAASHEILLVTFSVMRDHVHLLCQSEKSGSELLQLFKGVSSRRLGQSFQLAESPRWWTKSGSTRYIRKGDDPQAAVDYVSNQDGALCVRCHDQSRNVGGVEVCGTARAEARGSSSARSSSSGVTSYCVFVKHTNSCGVGLAEERIEAYRRAYLGDPSAAMGGILAVNFDVDPGFAEAVMGSLQRWGKQAGAGAFFVEVWVAPSFQKKAVEVIRKAKKWGQRVRLLTVSEMGAPPDKGELDYKRIAGGMLVQDRDIVGLNEDQWKVVTDRAPSDREMADLRLAWLICKHTKSNAISICKDGMLIGNGAGQMSRVMSCRIATWLAKENGHEDKLKGAVAASDAFFPFRDGPDILADAGVTAIIQPGGSKRDAETIAACNERGLAMIFTGTRHFKH